jgi:hypothetical protein
MEERLQIVLLTPGDGRRRMLARGRQVRAVRGTVDLDEAFGAAAGRTDLVPKRRTCAPRFPLAAEGTHHSRIIV